MNLAIVYTQYHFCIMIVIVTKCTLVWTRVVGVVGKLTSLTLFLWNYQIDKFSDQDILNVSQHIILWLIQFQRKAL